MPARLPAAPAVDPVEPLVVPPVVPAVEPPDVDPDVLPMLAFVKMNDAPEPDPEPLRDAVEPDDVDPLVDPAVPVIPLASPRCKQPVTVMVPFCMPDLGVVCDELLVCGSLVCAATIAAQPKPIANAAPTRFIE